MRCSSVCILLLSALLLSMPLQAVDTTRTNLQAGLQQLNSNLEVADFKPSPVPGIYQAVLNTGDLLYVVEGGEYLFAGSLLQLDADQGMRDLTAELQTQQRRDILAGIPVGDQVVFPARGEIRAVVQVFTDISCPYCVRLHEQVPAWNAEGIEVRYLAFPRQGVNTPAHQALADVWCADDPAAAMTRSKAGEALPHASCDNPVAAQFMLGQRLGIQGTPAIFLPDGTLIPGYVPTERLLSELSLESR